MNQIGPINRTGIRHPVISSDGYMYEERCIKQWIESGKISSPLTRQVTESVKECNITDECLNEKEENNEEDYDNSEFQYSKKERLEVLERDFLNSNADVEASVILRENLRMGETRNQI